MATSQTEVESQIIELSKESFDTFCDDISSMFGVNMKCNQQQVAAETVEGLKKRFKKLVAVNSVKAEGALDGTFQLVFDREGLFTLAGVIAMHPEQMILENRKLGLLGKARDMSEVLIEAGETLVGSWNRVFRKGLDGHGRFVQTNTFIGNPWSKSKEKIGLASDEGLVFVPYEVRIDPYPAFKCAVIFPKTIFAGTSESGTEQADPAEEKTQDQKPAVKKTDFEESDTAQKSDNEKPKGQEPAAEKATVKETATKEDAEEAAAAEKEAATAKKAKSAKKKLTAKKVSDANKSPAEEEPEAVAEEKSNDVDTDASDNVVEEKVMTIAETDKTKKQPVSETIRKMARSPAVLPGEPASSATVENVALNSTGAPLAICAKDVMQKDAVWGNPDDSIQQSLKKMQQHKAGYMMVGQNGMLEGIVSRSDLIGAISPYLRPEFAKWCRPLDEATLQIKIKWIMSRPVRTIRPETSLAAIMESMCQFGRRALPVVDQQGKVQGLVTVFDIFKALLNSNPNISTVG